MTSDAAPAPSSRTPLERVSGHRASSPRRLFGIALGCALGAVLAVFLWARVSFPSDRTPQGAYLRVVIAVNRGRAQDFFAYTETRAQHACYTIRDYRKKTRDRVLASFPEPELSKLAAMSRAFFRSEPLPCRMRMLRAASARINPGFTAKPSTSLMMVCADA